MSADLPSSFTIKWVNALSLMMHSKILLFTFSFSIFIAGIIALIRFKKINKVYYPFLYCIWVACINELVNFLLYNQGYSTYINNNIYAFLESLLIVSLFRNLGFFHKGSYLFNCILISFIVAWVLEVFVLKKITSFCVYFSIYYSFIIVLMSISTINALIVRSTKGVFRNATFLLCIGFIIYFTYQVLIYAFWIYGIQSSNGFLLNVFSIMIYINLLANLIYALSVLWMPRKLEFTLPY